MPRYLTPAKVCVLVLVDLYVSEEIPNGAKLGALTFISSQIINPSEYDNEGLQDRFMLSPSNITGLEETLSHLQTGVPGRSLYDWLLKRLWQLEGMDSLHAFFEHLEALVAPGIADSQETSLPRLSRSSPLGQLVRRSVVEFTRLQFADSMILWNALASFREPSYDMWSSRNPGAARQRDEGTPSWMESYLSANGAPNELLHGSTSVEDSHTLLSFSVQRLQKLGARVPSDVKAKLERWILEQSESGPQSLSNFMAFFERWRAGEHSMAEESLRRYFDYSLNKQSVSENVKVYYQYAYLHLSVLHADFECWEQSVEMMAECIASGRCLRCLSIWHSLFELTSSSNPTLSLII